MDSTQVLLSTIRLRAEIVNNGSADLLNSYDQLIQNDPVVFYPDRLVRNLLVEKGSAKMLEILDTQIVPALDRPPATFLGTAAVLLTFASIGYGIFHIVTA